MAVGSGAPPVNSEMEKLELGRKLAVPSEFVVRRLEVREDEIDGGGAVPDEVSASEVLLSSDAASCEVDGAVDAIDDGCALKDGGIALDAEDGGGAAEDEAEPAEESAALLEGAATLEGRIAELLGAGLLDAGGWVGDGCEDSLGVDSGVALLGSWVALLGAEVWLLDSGVALEVGGGDEGGALLELGGCGEGELIGAALVAGDAVVVTADEPGRVTASAAGKNRVVVAARSGYVTASVVLPKVLVAPDTGLPTIGSQAVPIGPPSCSVTVGRLLR